MKLSKASIAVLKNFASINPSIYLRKGNIILTKSLNNVIYAEAKIEDVIDADVGIYDVAEFLSTLGLFAEDVEIISVPQDLNVEIKDKRSKSKYTLVDPSVILYPQNKVTFPVADIQFELSQEDLKRIIDAAGTLGVPDLCITNANGKIVVKALSVKDPSANTYALEVADYDGDNNFEFYLAVENMKMIKESYKVLVCKMGAVMFEGTTASYVIALESNSTHDFKDKED